MTAFFQWENQIIALPYSTGNNLYIKSLWNGVAIPNQDGYYYLLWTISDNDDLYTGHCHLSHIMDLFQHYHAHQNVNVDYLIIDNKQIYLGANNRDESVFGISSSQFWVKIEINPPQTDSFFPERVLIDQ